MGGPGEGGSRWREQPRAGEGLAQGAEGSEGGLAESERLLGVPGRGLSRLCQCWWSLHTLRWAERVGGTCARLPFSPAEPLPGPHVPFPGFH